MEQSGFFLPLPLHQDLIEYLGRRPLRRVARMYNGLQNLPRGHIPEPQSTLAPVSVLAVSGDTDDGTD